MAGGGPQGAMQQGRGRGAQTCSLTQRAPAHSLAPSQSAQRRRRRVARRDWRAVGRGWRWRTPGGVAGTALALPGACSLKPQPKTAQERAQHSIYKHTCKGWGVQLSGTIVVGKTPTLQVRPPSEPVSWWCATLWLLQNDSASSSTRHAHRVDACCGVLHAPRSVHGRPEGDQPVTGPPEQRRGCLEHTVHCFTSQSKQLNGGQVVVGRRTAQHSSQGLCGTPGRGGAPRHVVPTAPHPCVPDWPQASPLQPTVCGRERHKALLPKNDEDAGGAAGAALLPLLLDVSHPSVSQ